MTKHSFYSLMTKDNKKQAVLQHGYTDGKFNYYKGVAGWNAIHPLYGLAVATGATRKEAAENAHSERVTNGIASFSAERCGAMAKEFVHLRCEARGL